MDRLTRKFATAAKHVPPPVIDGRGAAIGDRRASAAATRPCARRSPACASRRRDRLHARARLPVRRRGRGVPRRARDDLRRRAEPRRAAARAADAGDRRGKEKLRSMLHYGGFPLTAGTSSTRVEKALDKGGGGMSFITKPKVAHPSLPRNELGLNRRDYEGGMSTLCAGCGHDSVTAAIVRAFFELSMPPQSVAKLSGIGCSSKTPTYFVSGAHGFNSAHGRMPAIATGAQRGQPPPALHRRLGRRRLALDRPRPARARHPPQPRHGLRHREQRRLRAHQGPVLGLGGRRLEVEEGRGERAAAHRPGAVRRSRSARRSSRAASPATRSSWCR